MKVQLLRTSKAMVSRNTGIGHYSDFVEAELCKMGVNVQSMDIELSRRYGTKKLLIDGVLFPIARLIKGRKDVDVVHATAEQYALYLPFAKGKRVLSLHHVWDNNLRVDSTTWKLIWKLSVLVSKIFVDEYIAVSALTKKDMVKKLRISPEKIKVATHPPKTEIFYEDIPKENIVLFVGGFIDRKNPIAALQVFEHIFNMSEFKNFKLVMCGAGTLLEDIERTITMMGINDSVELLKNLSVEDLRILYGKSMVLLNTSHFEGLGLVTLEAQRCGTPVLYFKNARMPPEIMEAAIPCTDIIDMANKASELLRNTKKMKEVISSGIKFSEEFGKNYGEELMQIYNDPI